MRHIPSITFYCLCTSVEGKLSTLSPAAVARSCRMMVPMVGKTLVLGALLAVGALPSVANAQVPVPNARQLDFMELELTQFM